MNKLRLLYLKKIFSLFFNFENCISLVDIGAQGGLEPRWKGIDKYINYCGVEPDARSSNLLSKKVTGFNSYTIIPFALWSTSKDLLLNLCRQPSASSIFKPNKEFLDKFPNADRFDIQKTAQIRTKKLDEVFNGNADFLKIDTQGAELEIIKGSVQHLIRTIGLEVEVQFHKIYSDEPLFHDVASYLETHKFDFIDFIHLKRWGRYKLDNRGQLIFADALFLRSPEFILEKNSLELCKKYIGICLIYNRFDYINVILGSSIGKNKISSKSKKYIKVLEGLYNITFFLTRGVSNLQRRVHSNYRSHFLY
jgi:FkbM family methyltransferase